MFTYTYGLFISFKGCNNPFFFFNKNNAKQYYHFMFLGNSIEIKLSMMLKIIFTSFCLTNGLCYTYPYEYLKRKKTVYYVKKLDKNDVQILMRGYTNDT